MGVEVYTIQEVAEMLKVDKKVVLKEVQTGSLPAFRVGRQWRISLEALRAYMAKGGA